MTMKKLKQIIEKIQTLDSGLIKKTQVRLDNLTKPQGSLGRLEELAKHIVAITCNENPILKNKVIFTLAADHGVAKEGVSAFPQEVTPQMVYNFLNSGAAINVLARHVNARVIIVDMGVACDIKPHPQLIIKKIGYGTKNMAQGPAMTNDEALQAIEAGIEIFEDEYKKGIDIVGTGEMGIGNTTASSAIAAVITKSKVEDVTGRGTGINDQGLRNKISIIKKAIAANNPKPEDPIDVLAKLGGFEIAGLCGIILAAAAHKVPIVIDGFISSAAALIACCIEPKAKEYLIAGHCSVEKGHKIILNHIGICPLLNLDLRLGEGTGAALAINIVEAGVKILTEMATFKNAGVSERNA